MTIITIRTDGTTTTAVQAIDGKVISTASFVRPPSQKVSNYNAARIAIRKLRERALNPSE